MSFNLPKSDIVPNASLSNSWILVQNSPSLSWHFIASLYSQVQSLAQICLTSSARFSPSPPPTPPPPALPTTIVGGGFLGAFLAELFSDAHAPLPAMRRCFPSAERLLLLAKVKAPAECVALAVFAVVAAAACCAARLGQVGFRCHGQDAKQRLLQLHKLAAVSRRLLPLFTRITRQILLCLYTRVTSAVVCWASVIPPTWFLSLRRCVCAFVYLSCLWKSPRSLTSGKKAARLRVSAAGISYLNESRPLLLAIMVLANAAYV